MGKESAIEWTDATWNPVRGCTKVSPGCKNCYAETFAERWRGIKGHPFENGFDLNIVPHKLNDPLKWKEPKKIFVNSMSDLFHKDIPLEYILRVFEIMRQTPQHTYQILTKRHERLLDLDSEIDWPDNVWMGVSVENFEYTKRIAFLLQTHAKVKFISAEPLLGSLAESTSDQAFEIMNTLDGLDWVIVGGESGRGARPINKEWVIEIRDACIGLNIPFFFKQWGGVNKKATGRLLDGEIWGQMPCL